MIFFGTPGITSTSANFLANIGKEVIENAKAELDAADFLTVSMTIVGAQGAPKIISEGKDEDYVLKIADKLKTCGEINAFCAWVREAIKAKENLMTYWQKYPMEEWVKEMNIQMPIVHLPSKPTEEDIIGEMNIKERCEYYTLEALASTHGKYIHEDGPINIARRKMHEGLAKPAWTKGEGRDTLIFSNSSSVDPELVDKVFTQNQDTYRSIEQRLNSIKARIKEELNKRTHEYHVACVNERNKYNQEYMIIKSKFDMFINDKLEETRKLKIVIPERLNDTYKYLNSLGKQE